MEDASHHGWATGMVVVLIIRGELWTTGERVLTASNVTDTGDGMVLAITTVVDTGGGSS